jgi:WD40 repeat protein
VKVWEAASGRLLRSLEGHTDWVQAVALSPDGRTIVSGSWDSTVKVWEAESGRLLRSLEGHTERSERRGGQPRRAHHRQRLG